jgi:oxygen-independent coproporphyrinogen-3 oxidase
MYWKNKDYLGIGAGAHSHVNLKRWANANSVEEYIKKQATNNEIRDTNNEIRDTNNEIRDTIFMGLRLLEGIDLSLVTDFPKEVDELTELGLVTTSNKNIKLTRKGIYLANEVFERFV